MKKYVIGILVGLTLAAALIILLFWGQVHIGGEGCLIVTGTPKYRLNPDTEKYCYYYDMIINWDKVTVIVEDHELPVQLVSEKLGNLEIDILGDLREWTNTVKKSEYFEAVKASNYSIDQLELLYEYFVYCYDDARKYFQTPDYGFGSGQLYSVAAAIALVIELFWKLHKAYRDNGDDGDDMSFGEVLLLCLVNCGVMVYIMIMAKVTFWS